MRQSVLRQLGITPWRLRNHEPTEATAVCYGSSPNNDWLMITAVMDSSAEEQLATAIGAVIGVESFTTQSSEAELEAQICSQYDRVLVLGAELSATFRAQLSAHTTTCEFPLTITELLEQPSQKAALWQLMKSHI